MVVQKVSVVADSSISLPSQMLEQHSILTAPFEIAFGDHVYRDGTEPARFYELLRTSPQLPTTSSPSPASFLAAFEKAAHQAKDILCLTLSAQLSATYQSACSAAAMAKESLPGVRIRVVDTQTAAAAEGLLALAVARRAQAGADMEEVLRATSELQARVRLLGILDTLYYIWRGGHIPKVAVWLGSALQIKPLLELSSGDVHLVARPRTQRRALEQMLGMMDRYLGSGPASVAVVHAATPEAAVELEAEVRRRFQCRELFVTEFPPVIGAHTGPGLLGCAFYPATDS
ncbi:MAG: DegV family protein [Chloroflexi bacterium]|nr:DegV family protein [Chloroflexota bacterium]